MDVKGEEAQGHARLRIEALEVRIRQKDQELSATVRIDERIDECMGVCMDVRADACSVQTFV